MALLSVQRIECQFLHCAKPNEQQQQQQHEKTIVFMLALFRNGNIFKFLIHGTIIYTHKKAEMEKRKKHPTNKKETMKAYKSPNICSVHVR